MDSELLEKERIFLVFKVQKITMSRISLAKYNF